MSHRTTIGEATRKMAMNLARNLVYYAQLLKLHPLVPVRTAEAEA